MVRRDPERSHDMAKRKAQRSAKPRSGTKTRSKVKRAKPVREHNTRARSKQAVVVALRYGCGLRAGEVVRLKVKHIDSAQKIIRVEQSKGRKDRNVMQ
jgi:integrase